MIIRIKFSLTPKSPKGDFRIVKHYCPIKLNILPLCGKKSYFSHHTTKILPLPIDRNVPSVARNLVVHILLQRFSHSVAVFATALQNICSDLVTTGKRAPAGLNILIRFNHSKLQKFLRYLSDNNNLIRRIIARHIATR